MRVSVNDLYLDIGHHFPTCLLHTSTLPSGFLLPLAQLYTISYLTLPSLTAQPYIHQHY